MTVFYLNATVESTLAGSSNKAQIGFVLDQVDGSQPSAAASVIVYLGGAMNACCGQVAITGIDIATQPDGPYNPMLFPLTQVEDITALINPEFSGTVPDINEWGYTLGGGALLTLGTSICVAEYTTIGGRRNGRHYLPWIGTDTANNDGSLKSARGSIVSELYSLVMLDSATVLGDYLVEPLVRRRSNDSLTPITAAVCRSRLSLLRTRSR